MSMYFPRAEYEQRWQRVYAQMNDEGVDAAVVWSRTAGTYDRAANVIYLTNFYSNHSGQGDNGIGHSAVILCNGEMPLLVADEAPLPGTIATDDVVASRTTFAACAEVLQERGVKGTVALVGTDVLPMVGWQQLRAGTPEIDWLPKDQLLTPVRRMKSEREIDACRIGGKNAARAVTAIIEALRDRQPESVAAGEAARIFFSGGGNLHRMLISHGKHTADVVSEPVRGFSDLAPEQGDLVRGWAYGPAFQGYWMDPGRTSVVGKPTMGQRELIEAAASITDQIIAAIEPGKTVLEVARLGDELVSAFDSEPDRWQQMWPLYGHGNGLFFERPRISTSPLYDTDPEETFESNMVLGIEIFLARKGVGSAGFEQNIAVTDSGTELLTPAPMLWW